MGIRRGFPILALLACTALATAAAQLQEPAPPVNGATNPVDVPRTSEAVVLSSAAELPRITIVSLDSVGAPSLARQDHRAPQRTPLSMELVALGAVAGTVRAKVRCSSKTKNEGFDGTAFRFDAVYSNDPSSENKAFTDATPSLSLNMTISDGKPAADQFAEGKEYYLDFSPAE
jgi:hypothetical protein